MKLSTKGRYGLKAMLELAMNSAGEKVSLKSIAEKQGISENYLEQLFATLRKAGLVKSIRGAQGGYFLAKPPAMITVGEILRTLEGSLAPVDCVEENLPKQCRRSDECVTRIIWEKIRDKINEVVDSITLENLMVDLHNMYEKEDRRSDI